MTPSEHAAGRFLPETEFPPDLVKIYCVYRAIDMSFFCSPYDGDVTFVSSQARDISVIDTRCVRPVRLHAQ